MSVIQGKKKFGKQAYAEVAVDEDGRLLLAPGGHPIPVRTQRAPLADGSALQTRTLAASAKNQEVDPDATYRVSASGGTAHLRWDGGTATVAEYGFTTPISSGGWQELRFGVKNVSFIGTAAVGYVSFLRLRD